MKFGGVIFLAFYHQSVTYAIKQHEPKVYEYLDENFPEYIRKTRQSDLPQEIYQPPQFNYYAARQQDPLKARYHSQQQSDARTLKVSSLNGGVISGLHHYLIQNRGKSMSMPFDDSEEDWKPFQPKLLDSSKQEQVTQNSATATEEPTIIPKIEDIVKDDLRENDLEGAGTETSEHLAKTDRSDQNVRYIYVKPSILRNNFGLDSKATRQILKNAAPDSLKNDNMEEFQISELQALLGKNPASQLQGLQKLLEEAKPLTENNFPSAPQKDIASGVNIEHNGSPSNLEPLQQQIEAINKAREQTALAAAQKQAEAHVQAQHQAIALVQKQAQKEALAKIAAHNQGISTISPSDGVGYVTAAPFTQNIQEALYLAQKQHQNHQEVSPNIQQSSRDVIHQEIIGNSLEQGHRGGETSALQGRPLEQVVAQSGSYASPAEDLRNVKPLIQNSLFHSVQLAKPDVHVQYVSTTRAPLFHFKDIPKYSTVSSYPQNELRLQAVPYPTKPTIVHLPTFQEREQESYQQIHLDTLAESEKQLNLQESNRELDDVSKVSRKRFKRNSFDKVKHINFSFNGSLLVATDLDTYKKNVDKMEQIKNNNASISGESMSGILKSTAINEIDDIVLGPTTKSGETVLSPTITKNSSNEFDSRFPNFNSQPLVNTFNRSFDVNEKRFEANSDKVNSVSNLATDRHFISPYTKPSNTSLNIDANKGVNITASKRHVSLDSSPKKVYDQYLGFSTESLKNVPNIRLNIAEKEGVKSIASERHGSFINSSVNSHLGFSTESPKNYSKIRLKIDARKSVKSTASQGHGPFQNSSVKTHDHYSGFSTKSPKNVPNTRLNINAKDCVKSRAPDRHGSFKNSSIKVYDHYLGFGTKSPKNDSKIRLNIDAKESVKSMALKRHRSFENSSVKAYGHYLGFSTESPKNVANIRVNIDAKEGALSTAPDRRGSFKNSSVKVYDHYLGLGTDSSKNYPKIHLNIDAKKGVKSTALERPGSFENSPVKAYGNYLGFSTESPINIPNIRLNIHVKEVLKSTASERQGSFKNSPVKVYDHYLGFNTESPKNVSNNRLNIDAKIGVKSKAPEKHETLKNSPLKVYDHYLGFSTELPKNVIIISNHNHNEGPKKINSVYVSRDHNSGMRMKQKRRNSDRHRRRTLIKVFKVHPKISRAQKKIQNAIKKTESLV